MALSKFYWMGLRKKRVEGLVALGSILTLKSSSISEIEFSVSNQMSPLWGLWEYLFHKDHVTPFDTTYNVCTRALGGCVDTGVFVIWPSNYSKKNGEICVGLAWKKGVWGDSCPTISFDS